MYINKIKRYEFTVVHEYFGHDDRDCYTNESHVIAQTDDLREAVRAARVYTEKHEVGRYYEDGNVLIQTSELAWNDWFRQYESKLFSRTPCALIKARTHGPVYWEPQDKTAPDWVPF